jgi:membrane-associated HD superfamily phosphohydrolase
MKKLTLLLSLMIVLASAYLCQHIVHISLSNQINKNDSAELHHIRYGLFSVNSWKKQISLIVADEIKHLYLTNRNERDLKKHVEIQLSNLIDGIDAKIRKSNAGSAKGWMKQTFINSFVDMKAVKEGIPDYADVLIVEMTKAKTEGQIKGILIKRIEKYFKDTFDDQDLSKMKAILTRTGSPTIEAGKIKLTKLINANNEVVYRETFLLILLGTILFFMTGLGRIALSPSQYWPLIIFLSIVLIGGVMMPMIDMEAKISQMKFIIVDHPVHFVNQVLYFQSKSILDVFWIMITHDTIEMKLVGILMVGFSVFFPFIKIIYSKLYFYYLKRMKLNLFIKFLVLRSGKWSMADVLVVAIFMAYIGFNGIITSQFGNLNKEGQDLVILTTNGTSLQPGYYLFLAYTLLALFLSGFLARPKMDRKRQFHDTAII